MAEVTLRGVIERTFHSSPTFSAGLLRTLEKDSVRFAGKICVTEGEVVGLVGKWGSDKKYGDQFQVTGMDYDLPDDPKGLIHYLAAHPDFKGIGRKLAERIVGYAGSSARLDEILNENPEELRREVKIPQAALDSLRESWIKNSSNNKIRTYLASFELTPYEMDTLLETMGSAIVGILRNNPYALIHQIRRFGFSKIDTIARKMGTAKDHPGRIEAGVMHIVKRAADDGHTWIDVAQLVRDANDLLIIDSLDSLQKIKDAGTRLLHDVDKSKSNGIPALTASGRAVALTYLHAAEHLVYHRFTEYAYELGADIADDIWRTDGLLPRQQEVFRMVMENKICVISGGAGTGKTFVVARLAQTLTDSKKRVILCAPTGKAARRMKEVLLAQTGLDIPSHTIHRLLGYTGSKFTLLRVSADVVIVDEVSMVDVPLMAELLQRIDWEKTSVVFVGDHNQLPPVGPGNILRDLIQHKHVEKTILTEVMRQDGLLDANCVAILSGELRPSTPGDDSWFLMSQFDEAAGIQRYVYDLVRKQIPDKLKFDALRDIQIITPQHAGELGTKAINKMMQSLFQGEGETEFLIGDKIIQTKNDYKLDVMNGTIGFVLEIDYQSKEYEIEFEGEGIKHVPFVKHNLSLAYCLTAHKAQGSEFPCVIVICHSSHFFADRNWLYTAVTRAAKTCILIGNRKGLERAVKTENVSERRTFLDLLA